MQYFFFRLCLCFGVLLASFGCSEKPVTLDEYYTTIVTLPNGQKIRTEVMTNPTDMMRGMMFRNSLAPDRGMLFVHDHPGRYTYWMYQVRIPLDIIWLDSHHKIVEISADTPPCRTRASECPQYGGHETAQFVLELPGGMAKKYGLKLGETISF